MSIISLKEQVLNASPEELTLMLYEACENNIIQGIAFLKKKQFEQANNHLQRAEKIINEFICTLNYDYEISQQLEQLYSYTYNNLVTGNIKNDFTKLNEALDIISTLKDTWKQAIISSKST